MAYRIDRDPLLQHHGFTVGIAWKASIVDGTAPDFSDEVERECITVNVYQRGLRVAAAYANSPRTAFRKAWVLALALAREAHAQRLQRRKRA